MEIYTELGYTDRTDYLKDVALMHNVSTNLVFAIADLLGKNEDFDGLINMIEDLHYDQ